MGGALRRRLFLVLREKFSQYALLQTGEKESIIKIPGKHKSLRKRKGYVMKLSIGENIRKYRRDANMTQDALAEKLGVSYQSVSRWENGSTYPDMELLPSIADIFSVTVDTLLGRDEVRREKQYLALLEEYEALLDVPEPDVDAIVLKLRELRRDFANGKHFWQFFTALYQSGKTIWRDPRVLYELRLATETVLASNHIDKWSKDTVVHYMAQWEDDEHIADFLKENATVQVITKEHLLEERYFTRKEWEMADVMRQRNFFVQVRDLLDIDWIRREQKRSAADCLWRSRVQLSLLHAICNVTPDEEHPITGDGSLDLWAPKRVIMGFRHACYLASTGDTEGAFVALEDTVSLVEKIAMLKDGDLLGCSSPALTIKTKIYIPEDDKNCVFFQFAGDYEMLDYWSFGFISLKTQHRFLSNRRGWEWFDPIREDERYKGYVARLEQLIKK